MLKALQAIGTCPSGHMLQVKQLQVVAREEKRHRIANLIAFIQTVRFTHKMLDSEAAKSLTQLEVEQATARSAQKERPPTARCEDCGVYRDRRCRGVQSLR